MKNFTFNAEINGNVVEMEIEENSNKTYNMYISTNYSSGEKYLNITSTEIGQRIIELIDILK